MSDDPWAAANASGVHALSIPTPFLVGRVNAFLIDDDPLTLVDSGPDSGRALDELELALATHGRRIEDLERIVITHQHADHEGLVGVLARRSGADVCALDVVVPWLTDYGTETTEDEAFSQRLLRAHGVPDPVVTALAAVGAAFRGWGAPCAVDTPLRDGGELAFADRTLAVLHRPGHSPSDTVFHDAERGLLIGGDHLIGHISSNPLVTRPLGQPADTTRPTALIDYLASLRATQAMDVDLVLPGHGVPVVDHRTLIDDRIRLHDRRAAKMARLISERPLSAFEIASAMWGEAALTQSLLTISEVLGHIDVLLADGRAVERTDDAGISRFSAP